MCLNRCHAAAPSADQFRGGSVQMDDKTYYCRNPQCTLYGRMAPYGRLKFRGWHRRAARLRCQICAVTASSAYGLQRTGDVEVSGLLHKGPSCVSGSGTLIIAKGPAICSPLNGVGLFTLKPQ